MPLNACVIVPFGHIKELCPGEDNLGGIARIRILNALQLATDIDVAGIRANGHKMNAALAPTLAAGAAWAVAESTPDTAFFKGDRKGKIGRHFHEYEGGFTIAGLSAEQFDSLEKTLNSGCVFVFVDSNDKKWWLGSKLNPIYVDYDYGTGNKYDSDRQMVVKFKRGGYRVPPIEMEDAVYTAYPELV